MPETETHNLPLTLDVTSLAALVVAAFDEAEALVRESVVTWLPVYEKWRTLAQAWATLLGLEHLPREAVTDIARQVVDAPQSVRAAVVPF